LIDVEYDELPAVLDLDAALANGAPLVHDEPTRTRATFADVLLKPHADTNLCNSFRLRKGDVEAGFMRADHVFEDVFTSPPVQHVPLETHACIADVTSGHVTVWLGAQIPFIVRSQPAEIFRVPQSRVRVIVPSLGGGFGAKCYPKIEPVTAVLSLVARRPVRLHLTREEEFVTITKHGVRIRLKTGLMADGRIVARQSICHFNTGAYADIAHFKEMLAGAAQWIGWRPDEAPVRSGTKVRAKGLSCIIKGTVTPSTSTAIAKLNEDGTLDVLTSSSRWDRVCKPRSRSSQAMRSA
jgi:CO/xanthine dehydrogenase Mo-binding subunit